MFEPQPLEPAQAELAWSIMQRCHDLFVTMVEQVYELAAAYRRRELAERSVATGFESAR